MNSGVFEIDEFDENARIRKTAIIESSYSGTSIAYFTQAWLKHLLLVDEISLV